MLSKMFKSSKKKYIYNHKYLHACAFSIVWANIYFN